VAARSKPVKQELREYLADTQPVAITEALWTELLMRLAPVSASYLRELLRATGLPFEQPFAGVRQHTFQELEESLREMSRIYEEAAASGQRDRARYCRRQVLGARERAQFLAKNPRTPAGKREQKAEMSEWMLVWLENPEVFPAWIDARKRTAPG